MTFISSAPFKFSITIALSFFLFACGGSNDDDESNSIAGLWDTSHIDSGGTDVIYLHISNSGTFTSYDYQGDSADDSDDCYEVDILDALKLTEDTYRFTSDTDEYDIQLVRDGDNLVATSEDGGIENLAQVTNRSISDLQPICTSENSEQESDIEESERSIEDSSISISGLWDVTNIIGGETDVLYLHISDTGIFTSYNYYGDSYDNFDNCYDTYIYNATHISDDLFRITFDHAEYDIQIVKIDGELVFIYDNGDGKKYSLASDKTLSDFQPNCNFENIDRDDGPIEFEAIDIPGDEIDLEEEYNDNDITP